MKVIIMKKSLKKPYLKPKVIHETKLEVRAGSIILPEGNFPIGPNFPVVPPSSEDNAP